MNLSNSTIRSAVCLLAPLAIAASSASAQFFTLTTSDLSRRDIHGPLFSPSTVHFGTAEGTPIDLAVDDLVLLRAASPRLRPPPTGSLGEEPVGQLTLTDGRVLFGRAIAHADDDVIGWETLLRDRLTFRLDDVRSLVTDAAHPFDDASSHDGSALNDSVILENGDELTGFVLAYRPMVEIETDAGIREIDPQRVRGVVLASPAKRSASTLVALADGSVLACSSIVSDAVGDVLLTDADSASEMLVTSDDLVAVLWTPERVVGLASLSMVESQAGEGLRWVEPPVKAHDPLGVGDVAFAGPTRAKWSLPEGAMGFVCGVELPASASPWGACDVALMVSGRGEPRELAAVSLDGENRSAQLAATLELQPGETELWIEVRQGRNGPVQDTPVLRSPMVLLNEAGDRR